MLPTFVSYEETLKDKEEFNRNHKENLWKRYDHTEEELSSIEKKIHFFINTQNGQDVDEYCVDANSPVIKYLKDDLKDKSLLILGTGTAREVKSAREFGAKSIESTTLGNRNALYAKEVVGEAPEVCDLHCMPFEDSSFDIVAGFQVFEHSYMPLGFLLECNRVLKTGGMLCLETPACKTTSLDSWLHHTICPTGRQTYYMLIKTGFKPFVFNSYELHNVTHESLDSVPEIDDPAVMVMTKSIKMDPRTYERGDMARYYRILAGGRFSF